VAPQAPSAHERLLDLAITVLTSRFPVPAERLFEQLERHYGGNDASRQRKLSRDKEALRKLGIPIDYLPPGEDDEHHGYVIDRARLYMPDVRLGAEEKAALYAVGAAAVKAGLPMSSEVAHALVKLRFTQGETETHSSPAIYAGGARSPHDALLVRAAQERRRVRLRYDRGEERVVEPYAVAHRRGRLTVVGHCRLRGAVRTFHADRMDACALVAPDGPEGEFEVPPTFHAAAHLPSHPWQVRLHAPVEVWVGFAPELAGIGPRTLGIGDDGRCLATNLDGLVAQVLALGPGARIVGPPEARRRVLELLERTGSDA
jgi:proteasome accessory factor B